MTSANVYSVLKALTPVEVDHVVPVRLGCRGDGGYVIADDPGLQHTVLYSYGIDDNDSFDQHFHQRFDADVRQYDFSISAPPEQPGFRFYPQGLAHTRTDDCDTFAQHVVDNDDVGREICLKMDIEGAEWLVLRDMPEAQLRQCRQIVLELHDISDLGINTAWPGVAMEDKVAALERLNQYFYCWHVHANNYVPIYIVDGYKVPDVMELTFVSREHFRGGAKVTRQFPTPVDDPCSARNEDHVLDFWPFLQADALPAKPLGYWAGKISRLRRSLSKRKWRRVAGRRRIRS